MVWVGHVLGVGRRVLVDGGEVSHPDVTLSVGRPLEDMRVRAAEEVGFEARLVHTLVWPQEKIMARFSTTLFFHVRCPN